MPPDSCAECGDTPCEHYPSPQLEMFPTAMVINHVEFRCPACDALLNIFVKREMRCTCGMVCMTLSSTTERVVKRELVMI